MGTPPLGREEQFHMVVDHGSPSLECDSVETESNPDSKEVPIELIAALSNIGGSDNRNRTMPIGSLLPLLT